MRKFAPLLLTRFALVISLSAVSGTVAHSQDSPPPSPQPVPLQSPPVPRTQVTLGALTANNTAACPAEGKLPPHCRQPFPGQMDSRSEVATPMFDPPPGNVSDEDPHPYLTNGAQTKIFSTVMAGFCVNPNGGGYCNNNVEVGYVSNDAKTVAAQAEDMFRRHYDGAIMVWEGSGNGPDGAALKMQSYLNAHHCRGTAQQPCDLQYVIMFDGPSIKYEVRPTRIKGTTGASCTGRTGGDFENCAIAHLRNEMCYLNANHWGNDSYLKVNGRPVLMIFPDPAVIPATGHAPSWEDVWVHIEDWNKKLPKHCGQPPYNADHGEPLLIFERERGFTLPGSAGAYYWPAPAGTEPIRDQFAARVDAGKTESTLDDFYRTAQKRSNLLVWGAAFKGFNSSTSKWGTNRIMDQQCGRVWIRSLSESNRLYTAGALPFLQIATWNDYNEGTAVETGVDNCYRVTAHADGDTLFWNLQSTSPLATLATVSRVEIYDSRNGKDLTLLASSAPGAGGSLLLNSVPPGEHTFYVRMVGKNSILNRISPAVPYKAPSR